MEDVNFSYGHLLRIMKCLQEEYSFCLNLIWKKKKKAFGKDYGEIKIVKKKNLYSF